MALDVLYADGGVSRRPDAVTSAPEGVDAARLLHQVRQPLQFEPGNVAMLDAQEITGSVTFAFPGSPLYAPEGWLQRVVHVLVFALTPIGSMPGVVRHLYGITGAPYGTVTTRVLFSTPADPGSVTISLTEVRLVAVRAAYVAIPA